MRRLLLPVALFTASAAARADCPVRDRWPDPDWASTAAEVASAKAAEIKAFEDYAFTLTGQDDDRTGIRTDGVVIIRHGQVAYEKYARGFTATNRHPTWSVSKSATNALVGAAVQAAAFDLDRSICDYVSIDRKESCAITPHHLLEMSSGLDWRETYENASYQESSVLGMLYGVGRFDMANFVAGHQRRDPPGTSYSYSTGDATLLAATVTAHARKTLAEDWPWKLLFDPIGATNVTFERDPGGAFVGGSYWYASPRDMARFGFLYLNDGCWKGARILPAGWVSASSSVSLPYRLKALDLDRDEVQGRQFWLNRKVPEAGRDFLPWPSVPDDAYAARGHWGQSIAMVPSLDVVVVRTADDRDTGVVDYDKFLSLALAVVR